jgi:hypothetical protein
MTVDVHPDGGAVLLRTDCTRTLAEEPATYADSVDVDEVFRRLA